MDVEKEKAQPATKKSMDVLCARKVRHLRLLRRAVLLGRRQRSLLPKLHGGEERALVDGGAVCWGQQSPWRSLRLLPRRRWTWQLVTSLCGCWKTGRSARRCWFEPQFQQQPSCSSTALIGKRTSLALLAPRVPDELPAWSARSIWTLPRIILSTSTTRNLSFGTIMDSTKDLQLWSHRDASSPMRDCLKFYHQNFTKRNHTCHRWTRIHPQSSSCSTLLKPDWADSFAKPLENFQQRCMWGIQIQLPTTHQPSFPAPQRGDNPQCCSEPSHQQVASGAAVVLQRHPVDNGSNFEDNLHWRNLPARHNLSTKMLR